MERVRDLNPKVATQPLYRKAPLFFGAVRFQETIFALPFAYTGMVLAADGFPTWHDFLWITVAMISARTLGMSANRIIDRHIDARNPRTAGRHLPTGALRASELTALSVLATGVFFVAAAQLNLLALLLAPVAAAYLVVYPFTKRLTWLASFALGAALAIAPSGAWIGVRGALSWEPVLLSSAVALWAGSFDILYHVQDNNFYVSSGLHSVSQRFGITAAFRWSRTLDTLAVVCLIGLGLGIGLGYPYFVGCAIAIGLMIYKYLNVSPANLARLNIAFFRMNAYVSSVIFISTLVAVLNGVAR